MRLERPGKLCGIEAGRGVAALAVVLYHVARHLNHAIGAPRLMAVLQFGHAGVDVFFVISGFIIAFVHVGDLDRPSRLGRYAGRRFLRLMPPYWVALAVTIMLALAGGHDFPAATTLLTSATLLPTWSEPIVSVAWTLQYEIVFYSMFGLLILNRTLGLIAFGVWLVAIGLTQLGIFPLRLPPSLSAAYNLEFFAGMLVAVGVRRSVVRQPLLVLGSGLTLFAIAALAEDLAVLDGYATLARACYGIPAALIVAGSAEASRRDMLAVPRALTRLGSASYSIYLFQFVFIGIAWKVMLATGLERLLPVPASFVVLAAAGVLGGMQTSQVVEYRLTKLLRNLVLSRAQPVPAG